MIGLAIGAAGTIAGMIQKGITARRQRKAADKINPVNPVYEATKESAEELAMAKQLNNGDVAGGAALERSAMAQAANTTGMVQRSGATGAQVLSTAVKSQAQTNRALTDLNIRRTQNKLATAGLLTGALRNRGRQTEMVHQDKLRRFQEDQQAKDMLEDSSRQNWAGAFNDLAGFGLTAASIGSDKPSAGGGMGSMFGKIGRAKMMRRGANSFNVGGLTPRPNVVVN